MTWFKNSFKLLVFFVAWAVATLQGVNAFSISTLSEYKFYNQDDWINSTPLLMYLREWRGAGSSDYEYCNSVSPFSAWTSWSSMSCWKSRVSLWFSSNLKWQVTRWNAWNNDTSQYLFSMSQIKITRNDNNFNIQYYNNISKSWSSIVTDTKQQITLTDQVSWISTLYDKVIFRDDTVIFYNSETLESYQIKAWVDYHNWILLANPYDSDWQDNLRLIKLKEWKAWSTTVPVSRAWDLMIWNEILSNTDIYSLFWDSSTAKYYTISRWGVNPFPFQTKWQYDQTDHHIKSTLESEEMFLYSYSNNFQAPNDSSTLPDSNTPNNNPSNYYDSSLIQWYNECVNKWENLRKAVHLAVMCKNQDENTLRENIIYNTWLDYTWTASYCIQLDNYVVTLYEKYKDNWATGVFSYDINLQDNSAPINQLIFAWYYNSVVVWPNWDISWLPSWNSWCASWTSTNFENQNQSWLEKVANTFNNYFGSGVTNIYTNSLTSSLWFSWMVDSISSWTNNYFVTRFFNPYIEQFNLWTNAFNNVVNVPSCSNIHNWIWTYSWWNIALYGFSAILLLILLTLF